MKALVVFCHPTHDSFTGASLQRALAGLAKGGHDVRWVLGHIAISLDFAASIIGLPSASPPEWNALFGPGASGTTSGGPNLAELVAVIDRGHAHIADALPKTDPALLEQPHGMEFFDQTPLKTKGDVIAMLMTSHEAYHIAQLSACRCAAGLKPIF